MGIPTAIRGAKAYMVQLYINDTVYQPRPAMRKNIWRSCVSTAISKANPSGNCHKQSVSISGASVYHKRDQKNQSENTSGRHSRIHRDQRNESLYGTTLYQQPGRSTAIGQANAYLAQLCINKQSETKAKALLDDTAASTRAVYQPRSAKRKPIWLSCT